MKSLSERIKQKPWLGWMLFFLTMIVVFFIGLLASSIIERRAEAVFAYKPTVKISDQEPRNEVWGKNYPNEYDTYKQTMDTSFKSLFNSSNKTDALEKYPNLVIMWAGYAFSKEYNQARGHYWAIEDIRNVLRTGAPKNDHDGPQPNTCWTCKSPDVPRVMQDSGIAQFYKGKWASRGSEIVNPIGCADCHDPKTMELRITRPALIEAFQRQGKDINQASEEERRNLVCAQCHVEYFFKGDGKYLTFPWDRGISVEEIERYYDTAQFSDWTHSLSKTPMLKAQHPDYEIFTTGIHYKRGVTCADCHMPYISEGGKKFTDHKIASPLSRISSTCQVCHRQSEDTLRQNVYDRQKKVFEVRCKLEALLAKAHIEAKCAWDAGATEEEMKPVLKFIRNAQWRWDFAAAGHGNSFHSPLETARMLGDGIDLVQEARIGVLKVLYAHGVTKPIEYPDISTKEKAQKFIGLDMEKLKAEKQEFLTKIVPVWLQKAKEREAGYKTEIL